MFCWDYRLCISRTPINHDVKSRGHLFALGLVRSGSGHTVICTNWWPMTSAGAHVQIFGTSWGQLCQRLQQPIVQHHHRRHCCQVTSVTQRPAYFCLQHRSNSKANAQKFRHTASLHGKGGNARRDFLSGGRIRRKLPPNGVPGH